LFLKSTHHGIFQGIITGGFHSIMTIPVKLNRRLEIVSAWHSGINRSSHLDCARGVHGWPLLLLSGMPVPEVKGAEGPGGCFQREHTIFGSDLRLPYLSAEEITICRLQARRCFGTLWALRAR
jgi:hypothetical protein